MMKKLVKELKRTVVAFLIISMTVTGVEMPVYASENNSRETVQNQKQINAKEEPKVIKELKNERTVDSNTYILNNGMKKTVYYSDKIRYEEVGKVKEYNPEFVKVDNNDKKIIASSKVITEEKAEQYKYVNESGDSKQYMPKMVREETPVLLTNDKYKVAFSPISDDEIQEDTMFENKTGKVEVESDNVTDIASGKKEDKKVKANYKYNKSDVALEYKSLEHGVKEDIILDSVPDTNVFSFSLVVENMEAKLDAVGGITFIDKDSDDIVGGIPAPVLNDASENGYSEDATYQLEQVECKKKNVNKYILKVVVNQSYLNDSKRVYPVSVDPTVTWTGTGDLPDVYVLKSSSGTNYYASGVRTFSVGKGSQGLFRSYFRATKLSGKIDNKYVESAKLTIYENGAGNKGAKIQIRPVKEAFKCKTVTWDNQPGGTSAILTTFSSSGTSGAKKTIDLTNWARNIEKGSGDGHKNYGLLFRLEDESEASYVKFYGARSTDTSKVPKLTVTYYDGPTTASKVSAGSSANEERTYLKANENLKVSWSGIDSKALNYVQYRIVNEAGESVVPYSNSTKLGTTSSGTKSISVSSLDEGQYKIYVRGVDKADIKGVGKASTFYIDKTAPEIMNLSLSTKYDSGKYSNKEPKMTWDVQEKYIASVQVSINNGAFKTIGTTNKGTGNITGLTSGKVNLFNVRAVDKAGNISSYNGYQYHYDCNKPVIKMSITPNTDENNYDGSKENPTLEYDISDSTLDGYSLLVNEKEQKISNNKGSIKLENIEDGENEITITAVDKAGNESEETVNYYRDTTKPETGKIKITPKTGIFNTSSSLPTLNWEGFEDSNLYEVQVKIDDGEYKTLGFESSGNAMLQSSDLPKDGKYKITVRSVDKAGNSSDEVECNYYYDKADYELDDYTPTDVYAVEQIGGNTVLRFSTKCGKYRDDVKYQVYRATTPNVVINQENFVKSYSSKGAMKISGDEGVTYYYKLRTVKKTNEQVQYSDYSEEISSTTLSEDIIENREGVNSKYTYASVETPNGTGQIELSRGNFTYSQADISLPAPQLPVSIARVYNSKDATKSTMGYGWRQSYDMYVSEKGDKAYLVDGTNNVYTFTKSENKYVCSDTPDMSMEIDDDVLKKTIEKTKGNQKDNKQSTELEIDAYYKVTTKDGQIYRFDDCGRLLLIEETNGTFLYVSYNKENGTIEKIITSKGQEAKYSYNEQGLLSKVTAATDTKSEYSYTYEYNDEYLTKAIFNGTGNKSIEYKYDYSEGKLSTITDAEGNQYRLEYDNEYISKIEYPNREFFRYSFTKNQKETRPNTKVTKYNNTSKLSEENYYFSLDGLITEKTDAAGNQSTYTYDKNNKTLITDTTDKQSYYALDGNIVVEKTVTDKENTIYDSYGNVTRSTDSAGSVTEYTYDYSGKKSDVVKNQPITMKTVDANGVISANEEYEYDELGNVKKEIDHITNIVTLYTYGEDGEVKTSQELLGSNVDNANFEKTALKTYDEKTTYTSDGDEENEDVQEGTVEEKTAYVYDEVGNVKIDISDVTDIDEQVLQKVSKEGITASEIRDIIKDTNMVVMLYQYDEFFRTVKTTEVSKKGIKETGNKYNKNGSVLESKDEEGRVTKYSYDSMNREISTELIVGDETKTTNIEYSYGSVSINDGISIKSIKNTTIVTTTNQKGEVVGKTYTDALGRTVREMNNGLYTDYTYDNNGRVYTTYVGGTDETSPDLIVDGKLSVSTYDDMGNVTATIVNPEISGTSFKVGENSIVTKNVYDKEGKLKTATDGNGNVTSYDYDEQGRIMKVTSSGSVKETYSYDNLEKGNDGKYEAVVESVTYANGAISKTTSNGSEQIMSVKDETKDGNLETTYEYDKNGQLVCENYSDGSCIKYEYDVYGNQIKKSTYNSLQDSEPINITEYTYDSEGKISKTVDIKSGKTYRYTYYEYDGFGRNVSVSEINSETEPTKDRIESAKLKYVYNIDDNIEKLYYPNNKYDILKGIKFVYNKDKWITEVDGILNNDEMIKIRQYIYHNDGKVKQIKDYENFLNKGSDYIERDYTYDSFDRVTTMKYFNSKDINKILEQYDYQYDKNSNIVYEHEVFNYAKNVKDEETNYTYNSFNQLIKSVKKDNCTYKTTTCTYEYDSVGNRTYERISESYITDETTTKLKGEYTHSTYNRLNQLTSATKIEAEDGKQAYTYNYSYKYDKKGNQIEAVDGKEGTTSIYEYDIENQLIHVKTLKNSKKVSEEYNEYNGAGQRIKKHDVSIDESGKETSKVTCYFYEAGVLLYTTDENGIKTSQNIIGHENNIFATIRYIESEQKEYFYSKDVQGSTTNMTDNNGECVKSYNYTDFGETQESISSEVDNEICYTGGVYDELTGLYYLNARYYDSNDGVFISQDTYRGTGTDAESWNFYAYCAGNPISYIDPSGHKKEWISKKMGKVYKSNTDKLRICTDGKVSKTMKKSKYYDDSTHGVENTTCCFGKYVGADKIPYIVVPPSMSSYKFSVGVIVNRKNGNYLYCVVGEQGPEMKLGEVSIYAAWKMKGIKPPKNGKVKKEHMIGDTDQVGKWKFILFEISAPNSSSKNKYGWKYKKTRKLRRQIKRQGKKCYRGTGKCLN